MKYFWFQYFLENKVFKKDENDEKSHEKYQSVNGKGGLVIGQEQDDIGGYFDETQSWSGSVTQGS